MFCLLAYLVEKLTFLLHFTFMKEAASFVSTCSSSFYSSPAPAPLPPFYSSSFRIPIRFLHFLLFRSDCFFFLPPSLSLSFSFLRFTLSSSRVIRQSSRDDLTILYRIPGRLGATRCHIPIGCNPVSLPFWNYPVQW